MHKSILMCAFAIASSGAGFAKIELGAPFTDGAVLQRGMEVPVWGRVLPEDGRMPERIKIEFAGQTKFSVPDADGGYWKAELDPMDASSEGRTLKVSCDPAGESAEVRDVLVGEVWFASGQSNMSFPLYHPDSRWCDRRGAMMASMTRLPLVRYVTVGSRWSVEPVKFPANAPGWAKFVPQDLRTIRRDGLPGKGTGISAVAFFYARELHLALGVPVGIVCASIGGTGIDAWIPRSGYDGCDASIEEFARYEPKKNWRRETDLKGPIDGPNQQPAVLFNGMVAAYAPMAMRGTIWYQGEHNSGEPHLYRAKMRALFEGWRREFSNPSLKFYFVQLSPWKHNWPGICAAQTEFAEEEPGAAIAVNADGGNFWDIHPNDKEMVAQRLALHALKRDYGFDIPEDDSPVLDSAAFENGKAVLSFRHAKDWYVYAKDFSKSPAFELAGADGVWRPAKVENYEKAFSKNFKGVAIAGPEIVLSSKEVPEPVKARYMGRPRTAGTVFNEAMLPLGPFETR